MEKMRERRETYDISDDEYLDWKLNFEIIKTVNQ